MYCTSNKIVCSVSLVIATILRLQIVCCVRSCGRVWSCYFCLLTWDYRSSAVRSWYRVLSYYFCLLTPNSCHLCMDASLWTRVARHLAVNAIQHVPLYLQVAAPVQGHHVVELIQDFVTGNYSIYTHTHTDHPTGHKNDINSLPWQCFCGDEWFRFLFCFKQMHVGFLIKA